MTKSMPALKLDALSQELRLELETEEELVAKAGRIHNQSQNATKKSLLRSYLFLQATLAELMTLRTSRLSHPHSSFLKVPAPQATPSTLTLQEMKLATYQSDQRDLEQKIFRLAKKLRNFSEHLGCPLPFVLECNATQQLEEAFFD